MPRLLIPEATPLDVLKRAIPELRNPRYASIYDEGRQRRFKQALAGNDSPDVPLFSHNATYQSLFSKGWRSVSKQDIRLAGVTASREANHV